MLKGIKIRLYLDDEQIVYVNKLLGCSRFIYNNLLSYKIEEYNSNKYDVSFGELGKKLVKLKSEYEWIRESHSKVLQQSLINLEKAYHNFFVNHSGFPKFKSKRDNKQSCRFPADAIGKINGNRINIITSLKNIHFKCSSSDEKYLNKYQSLIKSATLSKTKSGIYQFSILIDRPNKILNKPTNNIIGIDLGIKAFVTASNGQIFENLKLNRSDKRKLVKLNRQLSKKQIGSNNRNKARIKLAKYNEKLNNKKENYLHHVANQLLNENQVIVMEDLNVKGMMKNHKLARSIQELSLFRFKEILTYKSVWYGRDIVQIDRFFPSSKLCNCCGYKYQNLSLNERHWDCPVCGAVHDRDLNAAINIEHEGNRILKIGLSKPELKLVENGSVDELSRKAMLKSIHSMKQEDQAAKLINENIKI